MGENSQMVLGARDQLGHCNRGLLYHSHNFHRLVAFETQERGQLHSRGCGLCITVMIALSSKGQSSAVLCRENVSFHLK